MSVALPSRLLRFVLGSIGLITLPHLGHLPPLLMMFFTGLLLWRGLGIWYPGCLPNRRWVFVIMLIGIALLISQQHGVFGRDAGTGLFVVALGLKLLEIHGKRDVNVIVYLAFIVAATQFLYEESILMAFYILLVCCVLLATLVIQNSLQVQTGAALKTAGVLIVQSLPLAIVLFVLFPRLEAPHWSWLEDQTKAKSGLSNTLEPGSISELSLSSDLVFRVKFSGEVPPQSQLYWRGPVYAYTDGIRWTAPPLLGREPNPDKPIFSGKAYGYTLLMEPQKPHWVFALDMPVELPADVRRNELYQLITAKNPGERAEYLLSSSPHYATGGISKTERRESLQLPSKASERIAKLVAELQAAGGSQPEVFIARVLQYFRQENFRYTLEPQTMLDKPIDTFLFERRAGFCSHYATAFVYLLRVAQIPARVVGGYQGGQMNSMGDFLEIRQANAHAWAEAWLEGRGWVRFDPTAAIAPERVEQGVNVDLQIASGSVNFNPILLNEADLSWIRRGQQLWDSVDYSWQRWVINYDTASQRAFLAGLGVETFIDMAYWMLASVGLTAGLVAWCLLKTKRRSCDLEVSYYQRFCKKLIQKGFQLRQGEGPVALAERAKLQYPARAKQIDEITASFIRIRYQADAAANDLALLKKQVKAFKW